MMNESSLLDYLHQQTRLFRTNCVAAVWYLVLSAEDKELFPELRESFAVAFQSGSTDFWLLPTEEAYDEEILLGLACPNAATSDGPILQ